MEKKAKNNKTSKNKNVDFERETRVLLEKIHSEFQTFGEGLSGLKEKLDGIAGMVAKNSEQISFSNLHLSVVKDDVNKINGKMAQVEININAIKNILNVVQQEFQSVKKDHETRIKKAEEKLEIVR